jgi:hypothetical protein
MALIKMNETHAKLYLAWLDYFRRTGEKITYVERTSAFFRAAEGQSPSL